MMAVYWKCRRSWKFPPYLARAARDTACQPNTTQLTTEAFWTGRRGVSEVRYILFNSEFGFCDILSSVKNVCSRIQ